MPALQIDIEAKFAQVLDALNQVNKASTSTAHSIESAFSTLEKTFIGALAIGAVEEFARGLKETVLGAIEAADQLQHLSEKTGIAVETLGGLGFAATKAGGNLESVVAAAGKLNKSIAEAAGGNKEIGVAFSALGIGVRDSTGQLKTADTVMAEISTKFAGYADGPEKVAIALRLFGKAGADIIPLLDKGGASLLENIDYYKRFSGVTSEVALASVEFNDTLANLNLLSGAFGRTLSAELLPTLQVLADELLRSKENSSLFETAATALNTIFQTIVVVGANVAYVFKGIGTEIGGMAAQLNALAHFDFKGFSAIGDAMKEDAKQARVEIDVFEASILNKPTQSNDILDSQAADKKTKPHAPLIPGKGGASNVDDPTRKILEGKLKDLEKSLGLERDAMDFQSNYLSAIYNEGVISLKTFYDEKREADQKYLQDAVSTYDQEIDALRAYQAKADKKTDRADAENKINEIIAKRTKLVQDSQQKAVLNDVSEKQAAEQYHKQLESINAELLDLAGNKDAAARVRIDASINDTRRLAIQAGVDPAIADQLGDARKKQADYNQLLDEAALLDQNLATIEGRITLERTEGSKTDLEALAASDAARKQLSASLSDLADKYEALSAASPFNADMKAKAEAYRLKVDELTASAHQLDKVFTDVAEGAFASFITDVTSGTKSISQAFKDMAKNIAASIDQIVAKELAAKLFGGGSGGGGLIESLVGSFAGSFFGGGTGEGITSGDSVLSATGDMIRGRRALGGPVDANASYLVGEHGPEVLKLGASGGSITPNRALAKQSNGGNVVYMTINTPDANSFRASDSQITAQMSRALQRSQRNL